MNRTEGIDKKKNSDHAPGTRNICLTIEYNGRRFHGWQIQDRVTTVQGVLESALAQITQDPVRLRAAGRTDAGVHAQGQVANFYTRSELSVERLCAGANALAGPMIQVLKVADVALDFDARRHTLGKHYRYQVYCGPRIPYAVRDYSFHLRMRSPDKRSFDLDAMRRAADILIGTHDFSSFRAADCDRESTRRTLYRATLTTEPIENYLGFLLMIDIEGTAFLKQMVRIISGTLCDIGRGRCSESAVANLLAGAPRAQGGITAPAHGLTLMRVYYPLDISPQ